MQMSPEEQAYYIQQMYSADDEMTFEDLTQEQQEEYLAQMSPEEQKQFMEQMGGEQNDWQ